MLFECLMTSLTAEGKNKVIIFPQDYTVEGVPSGPLLLKLIIQESHVDTRATVRFIRERLTNLGEYLVTCGSDIEKFNKYVRELLQALGARGETSNDILPNLFKGYLKAPDEEFRTFITRKRDEYDEGTLVIDAETLMTLAGNKYRARVEAGDWKAPTQNDRKLIALEATIAGLSKNKNKNKDKNGNKEQGGNKLERKRFEKPKWMLVAPKQGKPRTKTMDTKEYWWCTKHLSWVRHKPHECLLNGGKKAGNQGSNKKDTNKEKKVRLNNAYAAAAVKEESYE